MANHNKYEASRKTVIPPKTIHDYRGLHLLSNFLLVPPQ